MLLRDWVENDSFTWIMTAEILEEYAAVLAALRVRPSVIGRVSNLLREEADWVEPRRTVEADPDPGDSPFWTCAESGDADFVVTLNRRDFAQAKLKARAPRAHFEGQYWMYGREWGCFARKAAAFLRMSRSVRSSRFSLRSRASSSRSAVVSPVRPCVDRRAAV